MVGVVDQGTEHVETAIVPDVFDLGGFAVLHGEPAIAGQPLNRFAQGGAGDTQLDGEGAFARERGARRKVAIENGTDETAFGVVVGALWGCPVVQMWLLIESFAYW